MKVNSCKQILRCVGSSDNGQEQKMSISEQSCVCSGKNEARSNEVWEADNVGADNMGVGNMEVGGYGWGRKCLYGRGPLAETFGTSKYDNELIDVDDTLFRFGAPLTGNQ